MYAIIQDGGHQYKVEEGDVCRIQLKDVEVGASITFDKVAAVGGDQLSVGTPYVSGATVEGTVVNQLKGKKINVSFFRRRKDSRRVLGHRQRYTEVRINSINT